MMIKGAQARLPMSDLGVYLRAAQDFFAGRDLYHPEFFYRFKYPPSSAPLFSAFVLLPFCVAKACMGVLIALALVSLCRRLDSWSTANTRGRLRLMVAILFGGMVHYEIHLGQVTLLILLGLVLLVDLLSRHRPVPAGLLFALSLHAKPFGWPIALWAAVRGQWRFLATTMVAGALMCAVPVPFYGVDGTVRQWQGFVREMTDLTTQEMMLSRPENHTLASFLTRLVHFDDHWSPTTLKALANTINVGLIMLPLLLMVRAVPHGPERAPIETAMLLVAVPLIGPPEYKYYLLSIPLTWLAVARWPQTGLFGRALLLATAFGYAGNIPDLLGRELSRRLAEHSLVTFGGTAVFVAGLLLMLSPGPVATETTPTPCPAASVPSRRCLHLFRALVLLLVLTTAVLDRYNDRYRVTCRACHQVMLAERTICKNCGNPDLIPLVRRSEAPSTAPQAVTTLARTSRPTRLANGKAAN